MRNIITGYYRGLRRKYREAGTTLFLTRLMLRHLPDRSLDTLQVPRLSRKLIGARLRVNCGQARLQLFLPLAQVCREYALQLASSGLVLQKRRAKYQVQMFLGYPLAFLRFSAFPRIFSLIQENSSSYQRSAAQTISNVQVES